jgi:hypothetical protein
MSSFDEEVVREYFELNRFFVRQLQKHLVRSRKKTVEDSVSMLVLNPAAVRESAQTNFQLFSVDMATVRQALVVVHSWQHTRVTPAILKSNARLADFLKKELLPRLDLLFAVEDESIDNIEAFKKIAVVPGFPTADPYRGECITLLKDQGIDGVIAFSTILEDWLRHVEVNHSYHKSKLLQLVRVLKIYDMVQTPQLRLF